MMTRQKMFRLAAAISPEGGWSWEAFEIRLAKELGCPVRCITSDSLVSGEVTGAALRTSRGTAVIVIPANVSEAHRIHIAAHEAWHLLAGHDGCDQNSRREAQSEAFATTVGTLAEGRGNQPRNNRALTAAFGAVGIVA
jgi:hypothetical protein